MTNSILKTQTTLSIESRQHHDTLRGLVGSINNSLQKMEKRHIQLSQISHEHFDVYIRMQAEEHLEKQAKMISFACELRTRLTDSYEKSKNHESISQELIQQYIDELDILNFMDFEVTKKFFSFIHDHYQPIIIQLNPMAA